MDTQTDNGSGNPELYQRLGGITRQLHDALQELGHADRLQGTMGQLPDAKSRLNYIARLTGEAAEKVLNHVDAAKAEQALVIGPCQAASPDHQGRSGPGCGHARAARLVTGGDRQQPQVRSTRGSPKS